MKTLEHMSHTIVYMPAFRIMKTLFKKPLELTFGGHYQIISC